MCYHVNSWFKVFWLQSVVRKHGQLSGCWCCVYGGIAFVWLIEKIEFQ